MESQCKVFLVKGGEDETTSRAEEEPYRASHASPTEYNCLNVRRHRKHSGIQKIEEDDDRSLKGRKEEEGVGHGSKNAYEEMT